MTVYAFVGYLLSAQSYAVARTSGTLLKRQDSYLVFRLIELTGAVALGTDPGCKRCVKALLQAWCNLAALSSMCDTFLEQHVSPTL